MISVAIGGGFGALSRYLIGMFISKHNKTFFPLGTFFINILGSFLLGYLANSNMQEPLWLFWGVGFMGAFTTFSTFGYESILLIEMKEYKGAALYVSLSTVICILFAWLGYVL
ncbi:MAG: fluoride efflux transporter CrcB [Bacillaceae bacterium]